MLPLTERRFIESTPMSLTPSPSVTTILPCGREISSPAPIAAATGASIKHTLRMPFAATASTTARRSTSVIPLGTATTARGMKTRLFVTFFR